jgi:hypothetical protein
MSNITEEKLNLNFIRFTKALKKYGLYTQAMEADDGFNRNLKQAPAATTYESGSAYSGALINNIFSIAEYAKKINELVLTENMLDNNDLMTACLLHQISKAIQFENNDNDYDVKRGKLYKFKTNLPALKTGELSLFLAQKYNIPVTDTVYEAVLSLDKSDDNQTRYYGNMYSKVLRMANEIVDDKNRKNVSVS